MGARLIALSAAAAALLIGSSTFYPVEARHGIGGGGGGGGGQHSGPSSMSVGHSYRSSGSGAYTMRSHSMGPRAYPHSGLRVYSHSGPRAHGHHRGHRHVHRFHRQVFVDASYGYVYGDDCEWLRRRAVYTGSRYWWNRYNACLYGY